jgi:hypothetical protein
MAVKNSIVGRLRGLVSSENKARRGKMRVPITVSLLDSKTKAASKGCPPAMRGYLHDISKTGLSLVMPSVYFGDPYLMCSGYIFQITIEFPNRAISLQAAPTQYDRFEESHGEYRYLISARILQMTKSDRRYLFQYIKNGGIVPEVMNSMIRRLYDVMVNRVRVRRSGMRLPLTISLLDAKTKAISTQFSPAMSGYLNDISRTGLSLVIPSVRFGNRYPIGSGYVLRIIVKLPKRAVNIQATPVRYDRLDESQGEYSYLIGARILQMSKTDRRYLVQYIQKMRKSGAEESNTSFAHDARFS